MQPEVKYDFKGFVALVEEKAGDKDKEEAAAAGGCAGKADGAKKDSPSR